MKSFKKIIAVTLVLLMTLVFASCGGSGGAESEPIKIATKPMTEQYILGEMIKQLIENKTDYKAEITKGVGGGTSNIQPAMEKGDFDLYPEYTSSGWSMVLGHESKGVSDEDMLKKLREEYHDKYNMTWTGLYGFNNTFAVAVRKEVADKYNLETCSDMTKVADKLVFGGNPDYFEKEEGFDALKAAYNYNFKALKDVDIGLKYEAMKKGDIDVTNAFTTDAQLSRDYVKVLKDDKHLQYNYYCATVVREDALEKYPDLEKTLALMDNILTDKEMAALNYQVEVDGKDEADVAKTFLISKGLIEE
ncbi:glycine/betaine ABC transporter substrate-binding protein [Anaerovorax odorimutans]|uniref:Glycine/betaine ABC transporter substrate-binding protein n=1 Tax=Anaerovorax odorimutans TaxID=109327 RepID=A0ABT1RRH9_9FIRM|nr:glycine betaine ABC transporter substrate-binding protein [Anaerovorax odorimutans]MCQ4637807.1 glycine/betaine ABC transporter substrate-binding protein [Anaerovorax odorimutans]